MISNFERVFKVTDYTDPKPNPMLDFIKQVMPNATYDVFQDSIVDKGPEGSILYIGPTGENIISVHCSPDRQRVFIIPFVGNCFIKSPEEIEDGKELTLLAIRPFKINMELRDENNQIVGTRDEVNELQERLESLLSACRRELTPITSTLSEHHRVVQKALEWGLTWVYDGDPIKGLLDTIPNEPGTYLCGNCTAGLLYKLTDSRYCALLDTRKCTLIHVMEG